jgi:phospholipid/cholesterol/gamma-HCH transport system substrate-binding protein
MASSVRTKFAVGLFVVVGFSLTFIAVLWLGVSHYLEEGDYYVAYFDESVQGLDKDSPVKYRGVSVGRVESITVAPDATLIQAVLKIDPAIRPDENFVAQLKSVGITGIMFVELDRKKEGELDRSPPINFPSRFPVIATKPSDIQQLVTEINDILKQLKSLDLATVSIKAKATLDQIERTVADLDLKEISGVLKGSLSRWDAAMASIDGAAASVRRLSVSAERTVSDVSAVVERNAPVLTRGVTDFSRSMENAGALVDSGNALVRNTDEGLQQVIRQLLVALRKLETAVETLNRAADRIAGQPSQLLFSQPPPPRHLEP